MASKPAGYRYGSWLVLHGSGAHLVGFSTACWLSRDSTDTMGLWARCQDSNCSRIKAEHVPNWLLATRVLACLGVVFTALWLMVGCQCHCIKTRQERYKWMIRLEELLAFLSGLSSLLAVGVFVAASTNDSALKDFSFSWSLWLVVGGASATTVGGFIVAVTRNPAYRAPKPSNRTVRPVSSVAAGTTTLRSERGHESQGPQGPPGRHEGVTDIFNVISFTRSMERAATDRGRNYPHCWTEMGEPPPPYSVSGQESTGNASNRTGHRNNSATEMQELSLSPPPPYECIINEQPPPYESLSANPGAQLARPQ